ncbi:MAG: TolC family protein [Acidobacteriota bacterium]
MKMKQIGRPLILIALVCSQLLAQQEAGPTGDLLPGGVQVPESYVDRVRREGTILALTLRDVMRLALTNNLEIAIEDFNEDLNRERGTIARGFYDPILRFTLGLESSDSPSTSILTAGSGVATFARDNFTWSNSLQKNVRGGGIFTLNFNNFRNQSNSTFSTINPQFGSDLAVSFTQPLWRGFRQTSTERELKLINLDSAITESQFRQRVSEIVQQVQNQYWELVYSIEDHETRRQSMALAVVQYENNRQRVQIGVLAPIEITSAQAEVSTREQEMIQAEVQIVNAQNSLKQLLAPDPNHSIWNLSLIPTDPPEPRDVQIGMEEAIQTALSRRPELEQMRLELEKNGVDEEYFIQDGKPMVNVRANFGSTGRSGVVFQTVGVDNDGDGLPDRQMRIPAPDNPSFGNLFGAFGQAFSYDFVNWGIFADVEIPLFNNRSEGQLAEVRIGHARLLNQMKNQQQMIIVDVRNAYESLAIQKKRQEAARMARRFSEEQLDGETKRFEAGLSTNFEVLRFQRDLAQTISQELRAQVDYQQALTALRKAMYTIVDDNDIILAKKRDSEGN